MQTVMVLHSYLIDNKVGFSESLKYCPDHNLFLKIAANNMVGVDQNYLVKYRVIANSLSKKLFELLDNQVQIQIITSDIITGNNNSEQANSLAREIIEKYQKNNNLEKSPLQCKVISTKDIPLIHAKIYVIDGKCAIMGSANLTENSFQNFAEYVLISEETEILSNSFTPSCLMSLQGLCAFAM